MHDTARMKRPIAMLALLCAAPLAAAPGDIVATRIAGFREVGAAFKNINDELKSATPQTYVIQISARQIRDYARQQQGWFPAGSGPKPGVKTAVAKMRAAAKTLGQSCGTCHRRFRVEEKR